MEKKNQSQTYNSENNGKKEQNLDNLLELIQNQELKFEIAFHPLSKRNRKTIFLNDSEDLFISKGNSTRKSLNPKAMPTRAGGCIFFHLNDQNELELLLISKNYRFEDFGGKIEIDDKSISDSIVREVLEESNQKHWTRESLEKTIQNTQNANIFHLPNSKYLLILIELDDRIDPAIFGKSERKKSGVEEPRHMEWVKWKRIDKDISLLHDRLRDGIVLRRLREIAESRSKES